MTNISANQGRVLIAGGAPDLVAALSSALERDGHRVSTIQSISVAIDVLTARNPDVLIIGSDPSGEGGRAMLEQVRSARPGTQIILLVEAGSVPDAGAFVGAGLVDFLESLPAETELVALLVRRAVERKWLLTRVGQLDSIQDDTGTICGIVGSSLAMREISRRATQCAHDNVNVVIEGEEGTGRSTIARAIHQEGPRRDQPLIHVRRTEPAEAMAGLFGEAGAGTVFFEAVDALRGDAQRSILSILEAQEQEEIVQGSGDGETGPRIVALTSVDLDLQVQRGRFEGELYRRLKDESLRMPPLRERREDIPDLVQHFLRKHERQEVSVKGIDPTALNLLCQYDWPGNVRELEDSVRYAIAVAGAQTIQTEHLPEKVVESSKRRVVGESVGALSLKGYEKHTIKHALALCDGDILRAANMLGIGRSTLYRKMKFHGIRRRPIGCDRPMRD